MTHEIPVHLTTHSTGIIDLITGQYCQPVKVVEITEDCRGSNYIPPVIVIYGQITKGALVQFREQGLEVHFFMSEVEKDIKDIPEPSCAFGTRARLLGLTREQLWDIITDNAPSAA